MPKIYDNPEDKAIDRGNRRMDAYYYGFDETGVEIVDRILAAVAAAGKGSHGTCGWIDKMKWHSNLSYVDIIQAHANKAANEVKKLVALAYEGLIAKESSSAD